MYVTYEFGIVISYVHIPESYINKLESKSVKGVLVGFVMKQRQ